MKRSTLGGSVPLPHPPEVFLGARLTAATAAVSLLSRKSVTAPRREARCDTVTPPYVLSFRTYLLHCSCPPSPHRSGSAKLSAHKDTGQAQTSLCGAVMRP